MKPDLDDNIDSKLTEIIKIKDVIFKYNNEITNEFWFFLKHFFPLKQR